MLTLLTEPSLKISHQTYLLAKNTVKKMLGKPILKYSGHYGVLRSIHEGLKQLNVDFNYNPSCEKDLGQHVHVFGNIKALQMAIDLKKRNKIKTLTAGPNMVISSSDHNSIISSTEIDRFLVNSQWTYDAYLTDNPKLENRLGIWPAGVDEPFWNIKKESGTEKNNLLFYLKRPEASLLKNCIAIAKKHNYNVELLHYGNYKLDEFKECLKKNDLVVYFVEQESQGIALFEIWATNTPTIVWNPGYWHWKMKNYKCSSAPYLTDKTGKFFRDEFEFEKLIQDGYLASSIYSPKSWVSENGTDLKSAEIFISQINYSK